MLDAFDVMAQTAGKSAGLKPDQWPGLAHIFRAIARDEREACAQIMDQIATTVPVADYDRGILAASTIGASMIRSRGKGD
jgi:hypothetical protein